MFDGAIKLTHCFAGVRYSLLGLTKLVIVNYYSVNWQLFIGLTISGSRHTFQFSVTSKNLRSSLGSSTAVEDYLERILELINSKGYARVVDIAAALKISQASVTNMVQRLDAEELLKYEKYRGLVLTEAGARLARKIARRHRLLTDFLKLLGLDEQVIYHDVEGMEHHISPPTLRAIEALTKQLRRQPAMLSRLEAATA
jgi:Mn-dependent DtxR family transcriptional regulator